MSDVQCKPHVVRDAYGPRRITLFGAARYFQKLIKTLDAKVIDLFPHFLRVRSGTLIEGDKSYA